MSKPIYGCRRVVAHPGFWSFEHGGCSGSVIKPTKLASASPIFSWPPEFDGFVRTKLKNNHSMIFNVSLNICISSKLKGSDIWFLECSFRRPPVNHFGVTIGNPGLQTWFLQGSHHQQLFEHMLRVRPALPRDFYIGIGPSIYFNIVNSATPCEHPQAKKNVRGRYAWTWISDLQRLIIWTGHFESNHRTTTWFVYLCSRSPVPRTSRSGMVPFRRKKKPQRCLCTLFAAFESQILPTTRTYYLYTTYVLSI